LTLRVNQSLANTSTSVNYRSARPPRLIQIVAPFSSRLSRNILTQFMAAIMRGERWAICKYMDQQMRRPESGGWRARSCEVSLGGAQSAASGGGDLPPLQMIVQFVKPDPSIRPILP